MLDHRRLRAFQALDIGPAWQARSAAMQSVFDEVSTFPAATDGTVVSSHPHDAPLVFDAGRRWSDLAQRVEACRDCALGSRRQRSVFGCGSQSARWLLVGEAPGAEEDRLGEPFVGRAGALLDAMLQAAGLDRNRDVYIANVLKCRPPGNRNPEPEEVARCEPHLFEQIALLKPALVVLMGRFAAQSLLRTEASISSLRGHLHQIEAGALKIPAVVSYHPAYLLRNPADKRLAWIDWCLARRVMKTLVEEGSSNAAD